MLLTSLAGFKTFLEVSDTKNDTLLSAILTGVSSRIEKWLNREIEKKERTKYFNAGRTIYYLPAYPIDTAAQLLVYYSDSVQTLDTDYFLWEDDGLVEFFTAPSRTKPKEIKIIWTGGWADADSVPDDVQLAVWMQAAFVFRRRKDIGVNSISLPDGSISVNVPLELLADVKDALRNYRRIPGVV